MQRRSATTTTTVQRLLVCPQYVTITIRTLHRYVFSLLTRQQSTYSSLLKRVSFARSEHLVPLPPIMTFLRHVRFDLLLLLYSCAEQLLSQWRTRWRMWGLWSASGQARSALYRYAARSRPEVSENPASVVEVRSGVPSIGEFSHVPDSM